MPFHTSYSGLNRDNIRTHKGFKTITALFICPFRNWPFVALSRTLLKARCLNFGRTDEVCTERRCCKESESDVVVVHGVGVSLAEHVAGCSIILLARYLRKGSAVAARAVAGSGDITRLMAADMSRYAPGHNTVELLQLHSLIKRVIA